MTISKHQFFRPLQLLIISITLVSMLITFGCDDDNSTGSVPEGLEGAEVVIEPQDVSLEVDEQVDFSAFVVSASGDTVNDEFNFSWNWYSSNPEVFTVQNNGTATGQNPGEAFCIVEASTGSAKIRAKLRYVGLDSARVFLF